MPNITQGEARLAYVKLLAVNLLRRRLRDRAFDLYWSESAFYANQFNMPMGQLQAMAELESHPVRFGTR